MEEKIRNADVKFNKEVTPNLQQFIRSLLTVNIANRLGTNGYEEIMEHPWMKKVNYEKVLKKVYKPPFLPTLKDQFDTN